MQNRYIVAGRYDSCREPKPGIEPGTCRLRGDRSGRLSYKGMKGNAGEPQPGFEPGTFDYIRRSIRLSYGDHSPAGIRTRTYGTPTLFPLKLQGHAIIVEPLTIAGTVVRRPVMPAETCTTTMLLISIPAKMMIAIIHVRACRVNGPADTVNDKP